jgi:hypothetical protein
LAISGNSRWLAASSVDGYTRIYDLTDGTLTSTFPKARTPAGPDIVQTVFNRNTKL